MTFSELLRMLTENRSIKQVSPRRGMDMAEGIHEEREGDRGRGKKVERQAPRLY